MYLFLPLDAVLLVLLFKVADLTLQLHYGGVPQLQLLVLLPPTHKTQQLLTFYNI